GRFLFQAMATESRHVVVYIGAEGDERISQHSYPAGGNLLASDWQAGQKWSEHHFLEIPADTEAQRIYRLTAGLYDVPSVYTFTAYNSAGNQIFPTIGQLIVHGQPAHNPDYTYRFGDSIGLQEPVVRNDGVQIQLCLTWVSLKRTETNYHYFAHVIENDELVSQVDGQPRQGDYPTSAWLSGEVIEDCIPVDVGPTSGADGHINIGLYKLETFGRLPITRRDDDASLGDFITVDIAQSN
ncbi:MAG: hypothetical protein L0154_04765, partial [Chloroflexi bacterium]|nr:hypothetical protein [Chloroflexota bacterium]